MKKLRSVFALLVVLALSCGAAFAAPSAADLASAGIEEKMWGAFGVRDLKGLGEASDSVIATLLKGQVPEEMLQKMIATMKNADIRIGLTEEYEPKGFSFAAQTAGEFNLADYGSLKAPEFTLTAPAGTALTPLGSVEADEVGVINFAKLERDGAVYMIGATGDPAVLSKMAAAPEGNKDALYYTPANVWGQICVPPEVLEGEGVAMPLPVKCELGIQDTAKSVRFLLWSNVIEEVSAIRGKDFLAEMNGGFATEKPFLMGSGTLQVLCNVALSFLPENLKAEDFAADADTLTMINDTVGQLQAVGMTWEDLVKVLRNNVTIGIAGKLTTPMGEFPGLYLHLKGISETVAATLVHMAGATAPEMAGAAVTPFEKGAWKGVHAVEPVPAFVAGGPEGLLVGAMDMDQFGASPAVIPEIAPAAEAPNCFALAVNVKDLLPALKKINEAMGAMIYGEDEDMKSTVESVFMGLDVFDALLVDMKNADTLSLEFFFDPAKLTAVLGMLM